MCTFIRYCKNPYDYYKVDRSHRSEDAFDTTTDVILLYILTYFHQTSVKLCNYSCEYTLPQSFNNVNFFIYYIFISNLLQSAYQLNSVKIKIKNNISSRWHDRNVEIVQVVLGSLAGLGATAYRKTVETKSPHLTLSTASTIQHRNK